VAAPDLLARMSSWQAPALTERLATLRRFAALLTHRGEAMAVAITRATRKPITLARAEVTRATAVAQGTMVTAGGLAMEGLRLGKEHGWAQVHHLPLGPVLAITPFNFPLNLAMHKIAPALAAGCPIIWKPSPQAPGVAELCQALLLEAGFSTQALQVVHLGNDEVLAMCGDPRLALVSFTGSVTVGHALQAATRRARCILELGGNAAAILQDVPRPAQEAPKLAASACGHAGQVCISLQRILYPRSRPEWPELLTSAFRAVPSGDPWQDATVCGPVISPDAKERITTLLAGYQAAGGRVLCGGTWDGLVLAPTLIDGVPAAHPLVRDTEVFAPIATLHPYGDLDEAVTIADDTPFGLQASLYSNDAEATQRALARLRVGTVVLNHVPSTRDDRLPYGGTKDSGNGREGTFDAVFDYCQQRVLLHPG